MELEKIILGKLYSFLECNYKEGKSFEFDVEHNELILQCYVTNVKRAYRNRYDHEGNTIGEHKPEPNYKYSFDDVSIVKIWNEGLEEYVECEYTELINNKLQYIQTV